MNLKNGFYELGSHVGHKISIKPYRHPDSIVIKCETCGEVLVEIDKPFYDESGICLECGSDTAEELDGTPYCTNENCENSYNDRDEDHFLEQG